MPRKIVKAESPVQSRDLKKYSLSLANVVWSILFIVAASLAGYFYYQSKNSEALKQEQEKEELVAVLSEFVDLPTDETPTLATVTDRDKLADQPFFLKAENGDRVLIYSNAGKAILYRPSTKKIINMTTVSVNQATASLSSSAESGGGEPVEERSASVALLDGSSEVVSLSVLQVQLAENFPNLTVETTETATQEYSTTQIIDQSGNNQELAEALAQALGGSVGNLPEGEKKSDTDIIIIVGSEQSENTEETSTQTEE